jgi:hypothetical protein
MSEFLDMLNGVASVLTIVGFVLHCAGDLPPGGSGVKTAGVKPAATNSVKRQPG